MEEYSKFSGNYEDLNNLPTLFNGNYNNLTNIPDNVKNAITKDEADSYYLKTEDIANKADKSELFSGRYEDLTGKPTIPNE